MKKIKNIFIPALLIVLALLLSIHTINSGLISDDLVQRTYVLGNEKLQEKNVVPNNPDPSFLGFTQNYFVFLSPDSNSINNTYYEYGSIPWWSDENVKMSFWRPLTSATHWLDYKLWPDSPKAMHIQNIVWYTLLIAAVFFFYKKSFKATWAVFFAALIFVVDYSFILNVSWLACRNATMATLFGVLSIISFTKYNSDNLNRYLLLSVLLFLSSLLSAEAGIGTMAYIVSYSVFVDRKPIVNRVISLLPFILTIIAWRVIYKLLGYGTSGTEMYIDPLTSFSSFADAVLYRAPALLFYQLTGLDGIDMYLYGNIKTIFIIIAYLTITIVCLLSLKILIKDKTSRFFLFGAIMAVFPICTTLPSGRVLMFVGIGIIGFLISILYCLTSGRHESNLKLYNSIPLWLLIVILLVIAVPMNLKSWGSEIAKKIETPYSPKMLGIGDEAEIVDKDVIIINAHNIFAIIFEPFTRAFSEKNLEIPNHIRALSTALNTIEVERIDANTLIVKPDGGFILTSDTPYPNNESQVPPMDKAHAAKHINGHFRSPNNKFEVGNTISLPEVDIEILKITDNGQPKIVKFMFKDKLEHTRFKWLFWDWESQSYEKFILPAVSESVTINGPFSKKELVKKK